MSGPRISLSAAVVRATYAHYRRTLLRTKSPNRFSFCNYEGSHLTRQRLAVRVGDQVQVLTGTSAGQRGVVLDVLFDRRQVIIDGVNKTKRIARNNAATATQSRTKITREAPVAYSNVSLIDPATDQPGRARVQVRHVKTEQGQYKLMKVRSFVSTGSLLPLPLRPVAADSWEAAQLQMNERFASRGQRLWTRQELQHERVFRERMERKQRDKQLQAHKASKKPASLPTNPDIDTEKAEAERITYTPPDISKYSEWKDKLKEAAARAIAEGHEVNWLHPVTHKILYSVLPPHLGLVQFFANDHKQASEAHAHAVKF